MSELRSLLKAILPAAAVPRTRRRYTRFRWGDFRRLEPVSRYFGFDRGLCIDRYYIEKFLGAHSEDIRGHVLEVADGEYTRKFGGNRISKSDVLHIQNGNPRATIVGNLATGDGIPEGRFDCVILTQTFPFIYEIADAVATSRSVLRPGGVLLATFAGISQISRYDMDRWGDYWRLTDASAKRLFSDVFGSDRVTITTHGNVLAACAFLQGLAAEELTPAELDHRDPDYQMIVTVRAVKTNESPR